VNASATGATIYYDDVADDDGGYPLGDGRIVGLRPNGMGTIVAGLQNDDGTAVSSSSWSRLIDSPMTSILDYIKATSTSGTAQVLMDDTPISGTARGIRGTLMYHASATSPNDVTTSTIYNDGSSQVFATGDFSQATIHDTTKMLTPPAAGWTGTEINGASWQLGPAADINPQPYWDSLLWEAEYAFTNTAPTAPTLVTPASGATGVAATPTLTATFNDVDVEQNGRITYEVRAQVAGACSTSGTLMGSGTTTFDVAGANLPWTYSGTALAAATTYCWRAMATDSSNATSSWSALRPFTRA
jgi:hypothetical protein